MKKSPELDPLATRPLLDFSKGIRGKHLAQVEQGTNIVLIAPDLLEAFPDSESVNEALRKFQSMTARTSTDEQVSRRSRKMIA